MRVVDFATATHAGRVRRKNEDAYYAEPPLFAVADGMGGALAGELASRIAVQALGELVEEGSDEERLASTVRLANRRVAERATSDPRASGMGSTVTAALVGPASVAFAHVGDSRAYLWRGGVLTRLSDDHSLVAEWVKAGALAPEEAALHPQRSVITRALGADWQVDVDTWTTPARDGRRDPALHRRPHAGSSTRPRSPARSSENESLDVVVHALVDAANAAGGEDNITAVALRLGGRRGVDRGADCGGRGRPRDRRARCAGPSRHPPRRRPRARPSPSRWHRRPSVAGASAGACRRRSVAPVPVPLPRSGETLISVPPIVTGFGSGAPVRRRGRVRRLGVFAAVVALMLCVLWAALIGLRWSHFVGVDPATGKVAVYQGIPYDLGGGVKLFTLVHVSRIPAATLPAARRKHLFDHSLRSSESARSLVAKLEQTEP